MFIVVFVMSLLLISVGRKVVYVKLLQGFPMILCFVNAYGFLLSDLKYCCMPA